MRLNLLAERTLGPLIEINDEEENEMVAFYVGSMTASSSNYGYVWLGLKRTGTAL